MIHWLVNCVLLIKLSTIKFENFLLKYPDINVQIEKSSITQLLYWKN